MDLNYNDEFKRFMRRPWDCKTVPPWIKKTKTQDMVVFVVAAIEALLVTVAVPLERQRSERWASRRLKKVRKKVTEVRDRMRAEDIWCRKRTGWRCTRTEQGLRACVCVRVYLFCCTFKKCLASRWPWHTYREGERQRENGYRWTVSWPLLYTCLQVGASFFGVTEKRKGGRDGGKEQCPASGEKRGRLERTKSTPLCIIGSPSNHLVP